MVVIYNNINFKNIKCDKLLGYISVIYLLITAAIIYCPKLPLFRLY